MKNSITEYLDKMFPNPKCELNYRNAFELLIATVLSAQSTDKRVNQIGEYLFTKYDVFSLANAELQDIENIIMPVGTYKKKSNYIIKIARSLVECYHGEVPNNREYLEGLPGVGRKTCNVLLANIYNEPCIAVDTHVMRVSKRLNIVKKNDNVNIIEKKLMKFFPKERWSKVNNQMVLFGRYICKSIKPNCKTCLLKDICPEKDLL